MNAARIIKSKKDKKGFTLVELVVVIAILGVLAAIAIPAVISIINSADKSADETTAHVLDDACKTYYSGVRLGLINNKSPGSSKQANLPAPNTSNKVRHQIAATATVENACQYAQITDVIPKIEGGDFGYNENGTIYRNDSGLTTLGKDTTMLQLYGLSEDEDGGNGDNGGNGD